MQGRGAREGDCVGHVVMRRGVIVVVEVEGGLRASRKCAERCEGAIASSAMARSALGMDGQHSWLLKNKFTDHMYTDSLFYIGLDLRPPSHST